MQLSDFQFVKEDDDAYHLTHPEGRKFVFKKKGLNDKAHAAIKKLPRFAEGGAVSDIPDSQRTLEQQKIRDAEIDAADRAAEERAASNQPKALVGNVPGTEVVPEPAVDVASPVPASVGSPAPQAAPVAAAPNPMDPFIQNKTATEDLINRQQQDIRDYQKTTAGSNAATSKAYGDFAQKLEGMQTPEQIVEAHKAKDDELMKAFAKNVIDPDRYLKNQDTGSKIVSGISIILGGLGSKANGGRNLALEQINGAIDRDIDAQKNSQDKTLNLWKMNRAATDTDLHATLATQNQLLSLAQAKATQAQANATSAAAKLRASELITQLEQQKIQNRLKLGLLSAPRGQNGAPGVDPAAYIGAVVPEKEQDQAYKDLDQVQKFNSRGSNMLSLFDKVDKENTVLRTGGGLLRTPPSVSAMDVELDTLAKDRDGRINDTVLKDLRATKPLPGDLPSTVQEKRQNLQRILQEGSSSALLDRHRVPYQMAQPSAPEVQPMGGVQYQKVPGGWQRVR